MHHKLWRELPNLTRGLRILTVLPIILLGNSPVLSSSQGAAATPITQADIPLVIDQPGQSS